DLAMMILHDLPDEEKAELTEECAEKDVPVCHTVAPQENPRKERRSSRAKQRRWKVVFRERTAEEPRAHRILESTLTAPPGDDQEEWMDRVGQLITVLALGVMEHHWTRNPPQWNAPE